MIDIDNVHIGLLGLRSKLDFRLCSIMDHRATPLASQLKGNRGFQFYWLDIVSPGKVGAQGVRLAARVKQHERCHSVNSYLGAQYSLSICIRFCLGEFRPIRDSEFQVMYPRASWVYGL
jgi:hypothetical protein